MADETETGVSGVTLTPDEQAFFDNKGNVPEPEKPPDQPPAPEAEPAAATSEPEKKEGEPEPVKFVPQQSLHEERKRRQDSEKRLREIELENVRFRERFDILARAQQPQQQAPPKPEEDIFGAIDHTGRRVENLERTISEQRQAQEQDNLRNQLIMQYHADAQNFVTQTPDFGEAYRFLLDSRDKELQAMGYTDPMQREMAKRNDELSVVAMAMQNGRRPAEAVYQLAVARGYTKKQAQAAATSATAAADKLATIAAGQAANKSLTTTGGSAGADEMTAERLLKMPLDEFETWTQKHPAQARRIMGG